jgi:ABC-2 type transport system ATP-binding protein
MKKSGASIVVQGLSKRYAGGSRLALDNLSLSVSPGEVYGFLGPNGAGKSTTIRLLMNFIKPTSGTATILGQDIVNDSVAIKKSVGYLSGDVSMYRKMTGRQFIDYMNDLQPAVSKAYIRELTTRLKADLNMRLGELSRGNRQKIGIIQAFMHQPQILILDEPSSGLDPLMQEVFYELLNESKQRGATVFISSHILSEVQKMCDRVGIIRDGKMVTERNISEMATEAAQTFDITFAGKVPLSELRKVPGVKVVSHNGVDATIHVHGKLAPLFALLSKYDVLKLNARNLDLEEVFMRFYQEKGDKK